MEENKICELINKHLEFKSGLEAESIRFYADYGKVSGSMFLNVKALINDCLSEKQTRIDDLEIVSQIQADELIKNFARIKELEEALKNILRDIRPEDACRGKFSHMFPEGDSQHEYYKHKAYVGGKSAPSDESIVKAIEVLKQVRL